MSRLDLDQYLFVNSMCKIFSPKYWIRNSKLTSKIEFITTVVNVTWLPSYGKLNQWIWDFWSFLEHQSFENRVKWTLLTKSSTTLLGLGISGALFILSLSILNSQGTRDVINTEVLEITFLLAWSQCCSSWLNEPRIIANKIEISMTFNNWNGTKRNVFTQSFA